MEIKMTVVIKDNVKLIDQKREQLSEIIEKLEAIEPDFGNYEYFKSVANEAQNLIDEVSTFDNDWSAKK